MANIYKGTLGLVGNTPLVEVVNVEKALGLEATVLVKLEYLNPAGSVKDRIAKGMIEDAEKRGVLKEGSVIIEPTSGNTGIGLAMVCAQKGYPLVVTMAESFSVERRRLMRMLGAKVVLTPAAESLIQALPRKAEMPDRLIALRSGLAAYVTSGDAPAVVRSADALRAAMLAHRAAAAAAGKNLLVPKPKPEAAKARPGQRQRKPLPKSRPR